MTRDSVTLFLAGDVMTGRGIDQALEHPGDPRLYEPFVRSARTYLSLAEDKNGRLSLPLEPTDLWGDALGELDRIAPDLRIVNLETSITTSEDHLPAKAIHYRMHPANVPCLTAAKLDCCVLANNHVLDWGRRGLAETLDTLHAVGIATAGAGRNRDEARAPATLGVPGKGRVLVFGVGVETSGIPAEWSAGEHRAGVSWIEGPSEAEARALAERAKAHKGAGDLVVVSIHWGPNWRYAVPGEERRFAHRLIDEGGVDVVHGHSSHHPKGLEVYRGRLIVYGAGDFFNDYEGIAGQEAFRGDLVLAYFPRLDPATGRLAGLRLSPFQVRRFRLNRPSRADTEWLRTVLEREGAPFGTRVSRVDGNLELRWGP